MALHSAIKGKLISVIGDEVSMEEQICDLFRILDFTLLEGHLRRIPFGRRWRNQQKSSSKFYGCR